MITNLLTSFSDGNQRDLLFPPWVDALPTPPYTHGNNLPGNQSVIPSIHSLGALSPPTRTRVQIFEDVHVERQGN